MNQSLTFPASLAKHLQNTYSLRLFVETGTLTGATAAFCSPLFDRVFSVELSPHFYRRAKLSLAKSPNVTLLFGSSPWVLPVVLPQLTAPTLFWLDAHWSGCNTPRLAVECPLLDELRVLGGLREGDAVLIDDARLFISPPSGAHRPEEWPTIEAVRHVIDQWPGKAHVEVVEDAIVVTREPLRRSQSC